MSISQKLKKIVQIQRKRYREKGIVNIAIAITLVVGIMQFSVFLGEKYWPTIIQDKAQFVFIGSFAVHTLFQLISFSLYLPGYLGAKCYQKYLNNKRTPKPWKRADWAEVRKKTILNLILNQLIVYPLAVFLSTKNGIRVRFDNFPSFGELFLQTYIVYFIQDFFMYWGHRMFHQYKFLYKMHKIHHQYDNLYTFITEYFHPLDFIIANLLPSALAFVFLGNKAHCFTFFFWIAWKVMTSTQGHSGYQIPWTPFRIIPLVQGSSFHDHHHSHNVGNYAGSCYFWDLMLDTSVPYNNEYLRQEQKDKKIQ